MNKQAAKLRKKARGMLASTDKATEYLTKSELLESKAKDLTAKVGVVKAKIERNEAMIRAFEREISNIDTALADYGRRYPNQ